MVLIALVDTEKEAEVTKRKVVVANISIKAMLQLHLLNIVNTVAVAGQGVDHLPTHHHTKIVDTVRKILPLNIKVIIIIIT